MFQFGFQFGFQFVFQFVFPPCCPRETGGCRQPEGLEVKLGFIWGFSFPWQLQGVPGMRMMMELSEVFFHRG